MVKLILSALLLVSFVSLASEKAEQDTPLISYQYAIYLMPGCGTDPVAEAHKMAKLHLTEFTSVTGHETTIAKPLFEVRLLEDAQQSYAPPSLKFLGYFGRGISEAMGIQLQKSNAAIIVDFTYPVQYMFSGLKSALVFTEQLARKCKGLIWDEETQETFSTDAWHDRRLTSWHNELPKIANHTVIHAYKNNEYIRAITLGMAKFYAPDIVIDDYSWSNNRAMGTLINIVTQSMIEGRPISEKGALELDISKIKHETVKNAFLAEQYANAEKKITVHLKPTKPQEGDPNNILMAIDFQSWTGAKLQEKQSLLAEKLFGFEDELTYVRHDDKILNASKAAKQRLPVLSKAFNKGLAPGAYILLKAPFITTDGGNEWMWVEVIAWNGNKIKAILQNQPHNVPNLKTGAEVIVDQSDVFDYIHYLADGTSIGNETGKLMQSN